MACVVPGMKLIPQTLAMSCWYASLQMLIKWKEEQRQVSFANLISPEFDAKCSAIRDANTGIVNPEIVKTAKPLWVNGKSHIVVIAGIMYVPYLDYMVLVYDPWPVNVGKVEWRSLSDWYAGGTSVSSRDTGKDVEAVFLYVPDDL